MHWNIEHIVITRIYYLQIYKILALNVSQCVDVPLNKYTKAN